MWVYDGAMSQTERIFYIDRMIRQNGAIICSQVCQRFEVSDRQVKRDFEYMRDRLEAPLVWDRQHRDYRYDSEYPRLRFSDEKALVFISMLRSLSRATDMVPLLSDQVMGVVEQTLSKGYRHLSDRIIYAMPVLDSPDYTVFSVFTEAMELDHCVSIDYKDAKGNLTSRVIEPLRLINYSGRWYCVAFDRLRDDLRSFHMSRVVSATPLDQDIAERGLDEAVERYISAGFGIFMGTETTEALIRICGDAANNVEHQIWHRDQKMERSVDDEGHAVLLLRLPVVNWSELLGKILSFGACAQPLEPPELRAQWCQKITELNQLIQK